MASLTDKIDVADVLDATEAGLPLGFCVACGIEVDGIVANGRRHTCPVCGSTTVYAAADLLTAAGVA